MAGTHLSLSSPAFERDQLIPMRHTCEGEDISPRLEWMNEPEGTRSFVLIMEDVDAPQGTFTHWVLFDVPGDVHELAEGVSGIGVGGRNDFQHERYGGPCPPPNHPPHRYHFKLYALDVESLALEASASRGEVEEAMEDHILQEAELVGRFERRPGPVR